MIVGLKVVVEERVISRKVVKQVVRWWGLEGEEDVASFRCESIDDDER